MNSRAFIGAIALLGALVSTAGTAADKRTHWTYEGEHGPEH